MARVSHQEKKQMVNKQIIKTELVCLGNDTML